MGKMWLVRVGRCQSINEGPAKSILLSLHLCPSVLTTEELAQDHGVVRETDMPLRKKKHHFCTMFSQSITEGLNHYLPTSFLSFSKF